MAVEHARQDIPLADPEPRILAGLAQFRREVIGERSHDKVAASKRKGMWMAPMSAI